VEFADEKETMTRQFEEKTQELVQTHEREVEKLHQQLEKEK
jgi:hypothetical protein